MNSGFPKKQGTGKKRKAKPYGAAGAYRKWIVPVLAVFLLAAVLIIWKWNRQETGYSIIQAVIEDLPDYQEEMESWGYRVSALPKTTGEPENAGLMRYYLESVGPVLILEDQDGGMYCFYDGFDQYISERTHEENRMLLPAGQYAEKEYEDVLKTVRLQLCKRNIKQEPLFENTADADSRDYYDVSVLIEITAESLEDGNEVSVFGGGFFRTNYCSNNFEECRLWTGIDPESANRYSDHYIKQEYSAAQLLEYYRQGLKLQSRIAELYHERRGKMAGKRKAGIYD